MVEIIVALIAVFGAVLPYLFQRNKELNLKIADQKREAYASFLTNFTKTSVAVTHDEDVSGKEADLERLLARDQLLLYASDDVIKAYDAWIRFSDYDEKHDYDKEGELLSLRHHPEYCVIVSVEEANREKRRINLLPEVHSLSTEVISFQKSSPEKALPNREKSCEWC